MTVEIVLLAMAAAFLGLRLYSVLGRQTGHEQEPVVRQPVEERVSVNNVRVPAASPEFVPASANATGIEIEVAARKGLRNIVAADRGFDIGLFMEGAKSAYGMILQAYWEGDKNALSHLCDDDVFENFVEEIDARNKRGELIEHRLIRIENSRIVDASLTGSDARISIKFEADIATLVKDIDGNAIAGSLTDAVVSDDLWTFVRDIRDTSRNWKLDETDEA